MNTIISVILAFVSTLLLSPYKPADDSFTAAAQQVFSSSDEAAHAAYLSLLSGDRTLLDVEQTNMWWIPNFQDERLAYEYTCLDLDQDGVPELLVQLADDPCSYNAVFHFEDGRLFCWNSDAMETSCRDYPLRDGTMVRQYDACGTSYYTIFRYQSNGEKEDILYLYAREELIYEDSSVPCPYYEIGGKEVEKAVFEEQFQELVTDRILNRSAWTLI